jgi:hypothetical protein
LGYSLIQYVFFSSPSAANFYTASNLLTVSLVEWPMHSVGATAPKKLHTKPLLLHWPQDRSKSWFEAT